MAELNDLSAHEQVRRIKAREVSARELLDAHLNRIDERNPELNAIVALDTEIATRRAEAVDRALMNGDDPGALAGLVTAHKDLTETKDFPTTYGSPVYADFRPDFDSLLVERMAGAGAVALGKTNTPEFGAGSHTFNQVYGVTRNAFNPDRSAGGSSGGAAVALASGMVAIADGSDLGGSLRNPAAWNNIVGFRSSVGVLPETGTENPYVKFGITGAMGRTVDDMALLLSVLAQPDHRDPINRGVEVPAHLTPSTGRVRVAWSPSLGGLPIEPEIVTVVHGLLATCETLGWEVVEAEPDFSGADEAFETLRSWSIANDGLIGRRPQGISELKETLQDEVRRGSDLSGADIHRALRQTKTLWARAISFFDNMDLMIAPVTQVSPFPVDVEYPTEIAGVPMERYITWMRSVSRVTQMGLPALSLPAGFTAAGLPVGAQLIGAPRDDLRLLGFAKALENAHQT